MTNYLVEPEEVTAYGKELFDLMSDGTFKLYFQEYLFTAQGVQNAQSALVGSKTMGKLVIEVASGCMSHEVGSRASVS
jgi:NADPH2:quinone reductase